MANLNRIILVGRLVEELDSRITVNGLPVAKFRLEVERSFGENAVDYIDVVAWRKLAEESKDRLKKGLMVLVEGRIQNRSFDGQNGQRQWVTEVVARSIVPLDKGQAAKTRKEEAVAAVGDAEMADLEAAEDLPF
ncbi:MAG: single-stranded DNA-binding protein [Candidatus Margulisbacteria bacterium]|nr:single-stranded DNA-binding protein [Candidatus Margulisiibacteriota bacterium]MBU1617453.1 single-stranded DNA-binding protein [Candidatus Margulisiibacteriota bacterium]MBU1867065.1 single-stranded DNA-binding protein [Candidatus Margulisiibacteriota bacterium]